MGQIGVAITNLPTVIFLKKPFSDGLGGGFGVILSWVLHQGKQIDIQLFSVHKTTKM